MVKALDFKLALPRPFKPTGGAGVTLATLGTPLGFVSWMSPWSKALPHWRYTVELLLKAAKTRKISNIAAATSQMERALRRGGWL
jgi:hypothetical protein